MKILLSIVLATLTACTPKQQQVENKFCEISPGKYEVQSATYLRSSSRYEVFVMGAESCVKQPLELENVQMAQLNVEGDAKEAKLELREGSQILYLSKNFSLDLVSETQGSDGQMMREQSMWSPFLAGAAGMVAGSMISNALFKRPRHYQPPVMQPGQSKAFGVGGHGNTAAEAKSSYKNNLSKMGLKDNSSAFGNTAKSSTKSKFNTSKVSPKKKTFKRSKRRRSPRRFLRRRR